MMSVRKIRRVSFLTIQFLLLSSSFPAHGQQHEFLPPEQAYRFAVKVGQDRIVVVWTIAPGYYLYQKRLSFQSATPAVTFGTPAFPKGDSHHDDYFGTQSIYRDTVTIAIPFKFTASRPSQLKIKVGWQGCADAGLCYPPTTWETTVSIG